MIIRHLLVFCKAPLEGHAMSSQVANRRPDGAWLFLHHNGPHMLNVSPRTIRRRREQYGLPVGCQYSDISDNLDEVVGTILQV